MTITTTRTNRQELTERLDEILASLGIPIEELDDRRRAGSLTADEWAAWEEIDAIRYLLA